MKKLIAGLLLFLTAGNVAAQERNRTYTTPSLPSREVLNRLNLRMAWHGNVPMDGRRDGFASIQLNNGQVIALTRGGCVCVIDAESGRQLWRVTLGKAFDNSYMPASNSRSVFVVTGVRLTVLDRATGALQWEFPLPFGISAAPIADEAKIYFSLTNGVVSAFQLPSTSDLEAKRPREDVPRTEDSVYSEDRRATSPRELRPDSVWSVATNLRLDYAPGLSGELLLCAAPDGTLLALPKTPLIDQQAERYRFRLDRGLTVLPGIYDDMAYVATSDTYITAVNIYNGKVQWRFPAGGSVTRPLFATESDLYISVENKGLIRLNREDGHPMWKIPYGKTKTNSVALADRVIAVNNKYVYAADSGGRLMVLDRTLGTQLSFYEPFRDYVFPVANQRTDRLLLAANDGSIICLHDREYDKPLQHRKYELFSRPGDNTLRSLDEKLARKVTEKGAEAMPLAEALKGMRTRFGVDFFIDDKAFSDAGLPAINNKPVVQPRVDKLEVREVLKNIFNQVGATISVRRDVVWVVPSQKGGDSMTPPQTPEEKEVHAKLAKKTNAPEPGIEKLTLKETLDFLLKDLSGIEYDVDEMAFKAAGIDNVLMKPVQAKGEKIPLSTMLRDVVAQVGGEFEVKGAKVLIRPAKR